VLDQPFIESNDNGQDDDDGDSHRVTIDDSHHPRQYSVFFHYRARPVHSGHDPRLRVLLPFTEHQL
jgi:hypothetical protein